MRIIQLLSPDYNGLMKVKVNKEVIKQEYKTDILGTDMHGRLIRKTSHGSIMNKLLTVDI